MKEIGGDAEERATIKTNVSGGGRRLYRRDLPH